jgi:hypothetical protein
MHHSGCDSSPQIRHIEGAPNRGFLFVVPFFVVESQPKEVHQLCLAISTEVRFRLHPYLRTSSQALGPSSGLSAAPTCAATTML